MGVNTNINFLKRRGLIVESEATGNVIDYRKECKDGGANSDIACNIVKLYDENPDLAKDLFKDVDVIYTKLRPNTNDNRVKFRSVMNNLLGSRNSINSINAFSKYLEDGGPEVTRVIKVLREPNEFQTDLDIDKIIRDAKSTKYREYENSFVGPHFKEYRTKLQLKYELSVDGELINSFNELVSKAFIMNKSLDSLVDDLYQSIINKYSVDDFIKADLECKSPLYDESSNVIIRPGDSVEVKYLDMYADSYLSEFFAIYKNKSRDEFTTTYNKIIDALYLKFKSEGQYILDSITDNLSGIFYKSNTFIPIENIELYWSNVGRAKPNLERRLSIRYRLKPGSTIKSYVYTPGENVMTTQEYTPTGDDSVRVVYEPENLNESDFDWVEKSMESLPDDEKVYVLSETVKPNFISITRQDDYGHYELDRYIVTYPNDEEQEWAVGTVDEANVSVRDDLDQLIDDVGLSFIGINGLENFITIDDDFMSNFCQEEANYTLDDMDDDDLVDIAFDFDMGEDFELLDEKIEDLELQISDLEDTISDTTDETNIREMEYELSNLEDDLKTLTKRREALISKLRNLFSTSYYDECITCMEDPVDCLVNQKGIYADAGEVVDAIDGVYLDMESLVDYIIRNDGYSGLNSYDGRYFREHFSGEDYILMRIN